MTLENVLESEAQHVRSNDINRAGDHLENIVGPQQRRHIVRFTDLHKLRASGEHKPQVSAEDNQKNQQRDHVNIFFVERDYNENQLKINIPGVDRLDSLSLKIYVEFMAGRRYRDAPYPAKNEFRLKWRERIFLRVFRSLDRLQLRIGQFINMRDEIV